MTQEALKLALEALEFYYDMHEEEADAKAITAIKEALTEHAMQEVQRLGQEIEQEPVERYPSSWAKVTLMVSSKGEMHAIGGDQELGEGDMPYIGLDRIKERLKDTPPQRTEQEPVAWLLTDKNINSLQVDDIQRLIDRLKHAHHTDLCVRINGQDEWFEADWLKHMVRASPPQRTWVGLTDEERYLNDGRTEEEIEYARAIEAKLKEKNT